ncbi:MAG TPA: hypothetical protein VIZ87_06770, partial [Terrimicrobium sp.]
EVRTSLRLVLGGTAGQRSFRCVGLQLFWTSATPADSLLRRNYLWKSLLRELLSAVTKGGLMETLRVDSDELLLILWE